MWELFEVRRISQRPNTVRPSLTAGWLAFVSAGEKRRLPGYPAGWSDMSDTELQGLLDASFRAPDPKFPVALPGAGKAASKAVASAPAAAPPAVSGGLPVPVPPTVTSSLGTAGIDEMVRAHARQARQDGLPVIQGMVGVKRALRETGEDASPEQLRLLRKVFIDEFYFSR